MSFKRKLPKEESSNLEQEAPSLKEPKRKKQRLNPEGTCKKNNTLLVLRLSFTVSLRSFGPLFSFVYCMETTSRFFYNYEKRFAISEHSLLSPDIKYKFLNIKNLKLNFSESIFLKNSKVVKTVPLFSGNHIWMRKFSTF